MKNANLNRSISNKKAKRPLTPYNLFFRFKRIKIIQASSSGINDRSSILQLVKAKPGLEDTPAVELERMHPSEMHAISRGIVRQELQDKLLPFDGKRVHRKIPGTMGFAEMSRLMCNEWKLVDESTKSIFEELAEDGKRLHKERSLESSSRVVTHVTVRGDDFPSLNLIDRKTQNAASMPSRNVFDSFSMPSQCIRPRIRDVSADSIQCFSSANVINESSPHFEDDAYAATLSPKCTSLPYETINIVTPNSESKPKAHVPDSNWDFNQDNFNDIEEFCRHICASEAEVNDSDDDDDD
eukprot:scaffold37211_cov47-Cyclotella_meneghiniana.AAC.1